jgi:hypothetical protein
VSKKGVASLIIVSTLMVGMVMMAGMGTEAGAARRGRHHPSVHSQTTQISASLSPIVTAHNQYRSAVGVGALQWSTTLATSAQGWANHLAAIHQLVHSGPGENLWMGTRGAYTDTQKVDAWGAEQQYFLAGRPFPDVSTTGNWQDVGHYTQLIWWNTTSVGCAQASDSSFDYLVCQYSPPGNVIGQYPLGHP